MHFCTFILYHFDERPSTLGAERSFATNPSSPLRFVTPERAAKPYSNRLHSPSGRGVSERLASKALSFMKETVKNRVYRAHLPPVAEAGTGKHLARRTRQLHHQVRLFKTVTWRLENGKVLWGTESSATRHRSEKRSHRMSESQSGCFHFLRYGDVAYLYVVLNPRDTRCLPCCSFSGDFLDDRVHLP